MAVPRLGPQLKLTALPSTNPRNSPPFHPPGPLNLGHVYRYCALLNAKLNDSAHKDKIIYHYCSSHPHKRANSCFLICAWSVLYNNKTPEEAFRPFRSVAPPFSTWHDATPGVCPFVLTILDTLCGLAKAREHGFFNLAKFNIEEYEFYEQVENGDLNWCLEGKFLAFAGPHATHEVTAGGYHSLCPDDYVGYFKKRNVQLVIRLNKKYYDARRFTQVSEFLLPCDFLPSDLGPNSHSLLVT